MNIKDVLPKIKPHKSGKSDKFSWNIYRYLKAHQNVKVMFYTESWFDGKDVFFNPNENLSAMQTYIMRGNEKSMSGASIASLIQKGSHAQLETFSYCLFDNRRFFDITHWFFATYPKIGRCIFDLEHRGWWQGEETRFTQINKHSRRCNWCGKYHTRRIKKVATIERREVWE